MKKLRISDDLTLPVEAVTQKFAALGISGSGKTYGTGKFVEELLDVGAQVVIIDTVGNWGQGLRLDADGKRPGIAIPILGGEHGDVPLDSRHGDLTATTVVETRSSLVVDVSDFYKAELVRFVTAFSTALLHQKKRQKSPVMVVWEECQDVVPQQHQGDISKMVGAVEKLIKKGRNYGVGTFLLSQRAAAVNKEVLNQIETLFAFRQNSKHDRAAVRDWVVSQSIDVAGLAEQLPTLETGECFCWSPSWLRVLKKIRFGRKRTFDASATPDLKGYVKPGKLAPVDLETFKATMSEAIEQAKANDPQLLRQRIAELERAAKAKPGAVVAAKAPPPQVIERPVFDEAAVDSLQGDVVSRMKQFEVKLTQAQHDLVECIDRFRERGRKAAARGQKVVVPGQRGQAKFRYSLDPSAVMGSAVTKVSDSATKVAGNGHRDHKPDNGSNGAGAADPSIGNSGLRRMLIALAQRPAGMDRRQLGLRAGLSSRTGTFGNYLSRGRTSGWMDVNGRRIAITPDGEKALGHWDPLPRGGELLSHWLGELGESGAARMLRALAEAYPQSMTREQLAEAARLSAQTGTFGNYLSRLRGLELVEGQRELTASAELFD